MTKRDGYDHLSVAGLGRYFDVSPDTGLRPDQVAERLETYGRNALAEAREKSVTDILIDQFKSLLTALLVGAAGLSFLFDDMAEGIAILIVVLMNAMIGFWAEMKAEKSMAALRALGRTTTRVRRAGEILTVPAEELVPGDIVLLEAGDIVTADIRLMDSAKLQVDESLLTGESVPVDKNAYVDQLDDATCPAAMVYKGTAVTRGLTTGMVIGTGQKTRLGEIATLADEAKGGSSPLEERLQKLSEQLLVVVLMLMAALSLMGIALGRDALLMVKTAIALAVAAVPEGLPIVATLALARGMWKLAARNALIERLSAVETLGSVTVILTDKTGTLTENRMTVTTLLTTSAPERDAVMADSEPAKRALRVCALCYSGADAAQLSDPMERALVTAAEEAGTPTKTVEASYPRLSEEAFDPDIRMMATIHKAEGKFLYAVKGAPEAVLEKASHIADDMGDTAMSPEMRTDWLRRTAALAKDGHRVLALAEKTADTEGAAPYDGLTFLGLVGLEDPPRDDAAPAVQAAHDAGVNVVMATGDNAATALSIARSVGIVADGEARSLEGVHMDAETEAERAALLRTSVFARMSPKQKLELIDLHQQAGAVVAMTGDGVNDAPALKKADVGIAMGQRGTEVAKEAAAMILKDDAFASIVVAIQQGRVIFANIRTFVIYLMSCNIGEVLTVTLCMLAGLPLPLLPLQILFLNLVTDVFPALALGFGKGDQEILHRPPRPRSEGLLQGRHWAAICVYACLMTIGVIAAFYWALEHTEKGPDYAGTVAFMTMALGQLWHVFNMRSRKAPIFRNQISSNPFVWAALVLCLAIILLAAVIPPVAAVLHIAVLDRAGWMVVLMASLIPLMVAQIAKIIAARRKLTRRKTGPS